MRKIMNIVNDDILLEQMNSFIPEITPNGLVANGLSENRAIRNGIKNNNLNTRRDLCNLISLTRRVLETQNQYLQNFLYNKLEYLGFCAKEVTITNDMTTKQKNECFAGSYMRYCQNLITIDSFLDILTKLY